MPLSEPQPERLPRLDLDKSVRQGAVLRPGRAASMLPRFAASAQSPDASLLAHPPGVTRIDVKMIL